MSSMFQQQLQEDFRALGAPTKQRFLLTLKDELLIYWSEENKCLFSTSLRDRFTCCQKLVCSFSPSFQISNIDVDESGHYILAYGSESIAVVELPRIWGEEGLFENGKEVIHCKMWLLGESVFQSQMTIVKAAWFDKVPGLNYVAVLTSDNCLRFFNVTYPESVAGTMVLFDQGFNDSCKENSIFNMTCKVLGIVAVDFDFCDCYFNKQGKEVYQAFLLQESGDIWLVKFLFNGERFVLKNQAQIVIKPYSEDNYGCEYCSVICLPVEPPVLALGLKSGEIFHAIALNDSELDIDECSRDSSTIISDECLFIYESVHTDLSYLNESYTENESLLRSLKFIKSSSSDSYICVSDAGLHLVTLPWIKEINHFLTSEEDLVLDEDLQKGTELSYLLCTQPFENSANAKVCGCVQARSDDFTEELICLLSDGSILRLDYNRVLFDMRDAVDDSRKNITKTSIDNKKKPAGDFHIFITNILQKKTTVPIFRTEGDSDTIPAETYHQILCKTTKILREEYMQKLLLAKVELKKRHKLLAVKREEQMKSVNELQNDPQLQAKSEELGMKLETVAENMSSLAERTYKVLRQVHFSSPVLSHAEETWARELKEIQKKLVVLKRYKEHVMSRYENTILSEIPVTRQTPRNLSIARKDALPTSHMIKLRSVLKDQGDKISTLVNEVNNLNISIGR